MITNAEYVLWCACRLRNKYTENNDIWKKLYKIGEEMNKEHLKHLEEQKNIEIRQKVFDEIISCDYSDIEDLIK